MATITISQTISVCVTIEIPDSKLRLFLQNHENLTDYLQVDESKSSDRVKITSLEMEPPEWEDLKIDSIEKKNGNTYTWDGKSLVKE
jgi:hypothetical protein